LNVQNFADRLTARPTDRQADSTNISWGYKNMKLKKLSFK